MTETEPQNRRLRARRASAAYGQTLDVQLAQLRAEAVYVVPTPHSCHHT